MSEVPKSLDGTDHVLRRLSGKLVFEHLFDAAQLAKLEGWRAFREGIEILPLYGSPDNEGTPSAALLRYSPGACVPLHVHSGHEHIFVLEGAQHDADGRYQAGTCIISEPGSQHRVVSEAGCLVLAIWNRPVRFVAEATPAQLAEKAER